MTEEINLTELTADIVSAYVAKNSVQAANLGDLIHSVYACLTSLSGPVEPAATEKPTPVVSVKKSIQPGSITCLVCGKAHKSLKRHINTSHGFTPEEYRAAYDLPANYPMVAPEYAATRSELAKTMGLGRKAKAAEPTADPQKPAKAMRGRPKKAAPVESGE